MSISRTIKRRSEMLKIKRENGRITCPKCHTKLIEKPGYGRVCEECGWAKNINEKGENEA